MDVLSNIIEKHCAWCGETFTNGTAMGALTHMKREVAELEADINNWAPREQELEEFADVFGCLIDAMARRGFTHYDLTNAFYAKLVKNQGRTWVDNGDGSYSHVKG